LTDTLGLVEMRRAEENVVASWMEERDRLVEQTRVFVAGVAAAAGPARATPAPDVPPAQEPAAVVAAVVPPEPAAVSVTAIMPPTMPPRLKSVAAHVSERAEITQRVAAFRAHQSRLIREREAFYEATQSKIRNVLGNELKAGPL
jgi:hypothetical protein